MSSTKNDAVRVTLSEDSKEISEKMKQSQDNDQTIASENESNENSNEIIEPQVVEESGDHDESEQTNDETETKETDAAETIDDETLKDDNDDKKSETSEEKLAKTDKENKDLQDRLLRLSAEFENFKKRNRREMSEFKKFASEVLIKDLLPVLDNLDRALETISADEACKAINEGVSMTRDEMLKVFSKYGVQSIEALEKDFDPALHQAVGQEESAESPKNTVLKEFQKGYTIHGRLLRPSMVIVSS